MEAFVVTVDRGRYGCLIEEGAGRNGKAPASRMVTAMKARELGRNSVVESLRAAVPAMALYLGPRASADERVAEAVKLAASAGVAVLEAGAQGPAALSAIPHPRLSVPATLHASLMARLDRLGSVAREVAQAGAAIGREFGYDLLAAIADLSEPQLCEALDRLSNAGLVFARGTPPAASYLFKHALVQDAAYSTLLRARRQQLHTACPDAIYAGARCTA